MVAHRYISLLPKVLQSGKDRLHCATLRCAEWLNTNYTKVSTRITSWLDFVGQLYKPHNQHFALRGRIVLEILQVLASKSAVSLSSDHNNPDAKALSSLKAV